MPQNAAAIELLDIASRLLHALDHPASRMTPAAFATQWQHIAHRCRELANRELLSVVPDDILVSERRRVLAQMAVHLAVNAEWAAAVCGPHAAQIPDLDIDAAKAWISACDVLRHTTIGITRMLTLHGTDQP
ncbi:hypothetical protein [Actinomadura rupiterrae]|uniref:hypothetical protein n=1 Tax=Actinomadura rupiterrae TaxID=559627 RepID=UPI0020A5EADC|nr:hypothetical protein [Actinomadura rupiterrae]MCP2335235.1 hypothetical protein [Actinomadura rupiterrae]